MNVSISSIVVYYDYTAATGVTLSQTEAAMTVGGETLTLTATVAPNNATDKTVTWTTSDASVATVADGVVTAVGAGTATITATATNGTDDTSDDKTATCAVTVTAPTTYSITVKEGTEDAANWTVSPNPAEAGQTVTISYTGTKKVKSVKAIKKAPATVPVTAITLNKTETTITKVNGTATETLSVTAVTPDEATDKTYTWSSDVAGVATVDENGVVTAVAAGTAHIRATANDGSGVYGECTITVSDLSAYYSKMVECGCDNLYGICADGSNPMSPFTGQILSADQAIALAKAKAVETGSNCAVFYGNDDRGRIGMIAVALDNGTTKGVSVSYTAAQKGLTEYRGFYVSK